MKRVTKIKQSDLKQMIYESVKSHLRLRRNKGLNEEVDTGQIPSQSEKNHKHTTELPKEIKKEIRRLRNKISEYEEEGKDTSELSKKIQDLKKQGGISEIISETIKKVIRESSELPYLSDKDIHKQYEGFNIEEFTIKPKKFRYGGNYGWEIGFAIYFPNAEHPDFDEYKYENVDVWDEEGKRITWDGWYPEDISQQLIAMIRSEIQKHMGEMQEFKKQTNNESINRIVKESIRKTLNEKWYPEEGQELDYDFGMIAKLSARNDLELDEETIASLESIKDENIESESSYVNVMVRKVNVSCDQYGYCSLDIECAITSPDMPMHDIEEETVEILWLWIEQKTGNRLPGGFEWLSEKTVFDRRSINK